MYERSGSTIYVKFVPETKGKTLEELEALWEPKRRKHNKLLRCNLPVQHAAQFGVLSFYSRFSRFELHSHR